MGLKNIVLSLFVLACGGNTTGSSNDGSLDCRVNCMQDSGNNQKDGNVSSDGCCRYDGSLDGGVDGKLDGSYDVNNTSDVNTSDGSIDSGVSDGSVDVNVNDGNNNCSDAGTSTTYPKAVLTCTEYAEDCLCIHRPIIGQNYCYDASQSQAGPGRTLVTYRIYPHISGATPNAYVGGPNPITCFGIEDPGVYDSKLRVIDDLGNFDDQEFHTIVTEN